VGADGGEEVVAEQLSERHGELDGCSPYRWPRRAHPNKGKCWAAARYFAAFYPRRTDRWMFGDRDSGRYLVKFSWTPIVRHTLVKGRPSPDDPTLTEYWATRRRRRKPPLGSFLLRLLRSQSGRCPVCDDLLLHADRQPQSPKRMEAVAHRTAQDDPPHGNCCTGSPDERHRTLPRTR